MHLENNVGKTRETTNSTDVGFYYLKALLFTACAGPHLALGTQLELAVRGCEWR